MVVPAVFFQSTNFIDACYIVAFGLFIYGMSGLTGPRTAVRGNLIAATGMAVAVIAKVTKPTAPMRARVFPSIAVPSVAAWEHLRVAGLVTDARGQEAAALLAPLFSCGGPLGLRERLGPAVGGDDGGEIGELLGLERQKLVAGLRRLQGAGRTLALADQRRHLRPVGVEVADDSRLDAHGVLLASHRILPARLSVRDQRLF